MLIVSSVIRSAVARTSFSLLRESVAAEHSWRKTSSSAQTQKTGSTHNKTSCFVVIRCFSNHHRNLNSDIIMKEIKSKVELHVHLDGAIRASTLWELSKKKNIPLPYENVADLAAACIPQKPYSLDNFLKSFRLIVPAIYGDLEAIERISYEFCEDCSQQNIIYSEVRYSPHILTGPMRVDDIKDNSVSLEQVVESVNRGLKRGSSDFDVIVRSILCCFRPFPAWSEDVLDLCVKYRDEGVVGIDLAGNEPTHEHETDAQILNTFKKAKELGIHRTVHAGESGPAVAVKEAIEELYADRVGHGYHSVDDDSVYQLVRDRDIHLEACPYSSVVTGAVSEDFTKHPIVKFAKDQINYSISTDDPIVTGTKLSDDYNIVMNKMGISPEEIMRTNLNAARSSFLAEKEKQLLIKRLKDEYGI